MRSLLSLVRSRHIHHRIRIHHRIHHRIRGHRHRSRSRSRRRSHIRIRCRWSRNCPGSCLDLRGRRIPIHAHHPAPSLRCCGAGRRDQMSIDPARARAGHDQDPGVDVLLVRGRIQTPFVRLVDQLRNILDRDPAIDVSHHGSTKVCIPET
jgi:hypothetical protein